MFIYEAILDETLNQIHNTYSVVMDSTQPWPHTF